MYLAVSCSKGYETDFTLHIKIVRFNRPKQRNTQIKYFLISMPGRSRSTYVIKVQTIMDGSYSAGRSRGGTVIGRKKFRTCILIFTSKTHRKISRRVTTFKHNYVSSPKIASKYIILN